MTLMMGPGFSAESATICPWHVYNSGHGDWTRAQISSCQATFTLYPTWAANPKWENCSAVSCREVERGSLKLHPFCIYTHVLPV